MQLTYRLNLAAIILAAAVVILGAYTRLTDAGLGCPDWPGCYGFLTVPVKADDVIQAQQAFPERPVETHKAWNEMVHRYFAGSLGLLIAVIWAFCLKQRQQVVLSSALLITVCFQAILGMWTVTMNLMPLVVMGHLLGGFTTFCLLVLLALNLRRSIHASSISWSPSAHCHKFYSYSKWVLLVLVLQIALGGWTASNYAAVVCTELPICEGDWQSKFDFARAFSVPTGYSTYEYGVFPYEARMTIHIMHRLGAVITILTVLAFAWVLTRSKSTRLRGYSIALSTIVAIQFALGISNVVLQLPLMIAVAHNFVALCLLACLITLMFKLREQGIQQHGFNTWVKE